MDVLIDNFDLVWDGFQKTVQLAVVSGIIALLLGTFIAALRVSPIRVLRGVGTVYVNVFRNTPLLVLLFLVFFGLPELGINLGVFTKNYLALSIYTAAFVCEVVRSGINSVDIGQAEAARSVGMGFGTTMTQVVLPQSFRAVVPPMASVFIALIKNTSLCSIFGILELTGRMKGLFNDYASSRWAIFIGIALCYVLLVELVSLVASWLERRWRIA